MEDSELRLDGNAVAGLLREVFIQEVTDARSACAACGAIAQVGAQLVYMSSGAPGAVIRCCHCENVLMVVVRDAGRHWLGCAGLKWLEIRAHA
jgi:hypothetical protein